MSKFPLLITGVTYNSFNVLRWVIREDSEANPLTEEDSAVYTGNLTWQQMQEMRVHHVSQVCSALNLTQALDHSVLKHILVDTKHKVLMCFVPKLTITPPQPPSPLAHHSPTINSPSPPLPPPPAHHNPTSTNPPPPLPPPIPHPAHHNPPPTHLPPPLPHNPLPTQHQLTITPTTQPTITPSSLATGRVHVLEAYVVLALGSGRRGRGRDGPDETPSPRAFPVHAGQLQVLGVTGQGHNVTFSEFITWVTPPNGTWTFAQKNEHWLPMTELCAPCAVQYDVIGRYEHLQKDVNQTLHWLGAGQFAERFPQADRPYHATALHKDYLQRLSMPEKLRFLRTYLLDFLLFGYEMT
ncbi:hypothetical protein C7M84_010833 [Penaeus vannamei]|uniref:Carbohydrate sulfotransferase n=1 Tax=Penaeus vannamei TaxID=6689 RepID=A0A423T3A1_PENVA|nr:hypothetical protein C7M84_010833 [Penaeus vannamei]